MQRQAAIRRQSHRPPLPPSPHIYYLLFRRSIIKALYREAIIWRRWQAFEVISIRRNNRARSFSRFNIIDRTLVTASERAWSAAIIAAVLQLQLPLLPADRDPPLLPPETGQLQPVPFEPLHVIGHHPTGEDLHGALPTTPTAFTLSIFPPRRTQYRRNLTFTPNRHNE